MAKGRVYISGPITGTKDYLKRFDKYERAIKKEGYEVVNPAKCNMYLPATVTHAEIMEVCYKQLEMCDNIFMTKGWEKSKGCRLEFAFACDHGITIVFEEGMKKC